MRFTDILWMGLIIGAALYLLYQSLFKKKKKDPCADCDSGVCEPEKKNEV